MHEINFSVHKRFLTTSDILTNIFFNQHWTFFYTTYDFVTTNKAEMFTKAQLKLVK